ncbi:MAG: hypothetical protein AAF600_22405 [Bacteroidota bacterium]
MLEAINLTKKYGEHETLTDLNPSVLLGEVFCLIDVSGAGKTTAIILYIGFTRPSSEQVKAGKMWGCIEPNHNLPNTSSILQTSGEVLPRWRSG